MLLSHLGKSKATSFEDNDQYSLVAVRAVLTLAYYSIDYTAENIFLAIRSKGFEALNALVLTYGKDHSSAAKMVESITEGLEKRQRATQLLSLQLQNKRTQLQKLADKPRLTKAEKADKEELERDIPECEIKVAPITAYDWAVMVKLALTRGHILDFSKLEVHAALRVLLFDLRDYFSAFVANSNKSGEGQNVSFDPQIINVAIKEFLGQLSLLNQTDTMQVIHEYVRTAQEVVKHKDQNKVDKTMIAMTMGPGLLEGLTLLGQFIERSVDDAHNARAQSLEYRFFGKVMEGLIEDAIFQAKFHPDLYIGLRQKRFAAELATVQSQVALVVRAKLWGNFAQTTPMGDADLVLQSSNSNSPKQGFLVRQLSRLSLTGGSSSPRNASPRAATSPKRVPTPGHKAEPSHDDISRTPPSIVPGYALIARMNSTPSVPRRESDEVKKDRRPGA